MKYNQFLEAREILESQGLKFTDIKGMNKTQLNEVFENRPVLNEFFGINKFFKDQLLKHGKWNNVIDSNAKKIKKDLTNKVKKGLSKLVNIRNENQGKIDKIADSGNKEEIRKFNNILAKIENKIVTISQDISTKLIDLKTKEIHRRLEESSLSDGAQATLKYVWESKMADMKMSMLANLYEENILTSKIIKKSISDAHTKKKGELDKEAKAAADLTKKEGGGEASKEDKQKANQAAKEATGDVQQHLKKLEKEGGGKEEVSSDVKKKANKAATDATGTVKKHLKKISSEDALPEDEPEKL